MSAHTRTAVRAAALCMVALVAACSPAGDVTEAVGASAASNTVPTVAPSSTAGTESTLGPGSSTSQGPASGSTPTSTPYDGPAITLTIGTDDSPGVPSADEISHFVDVVKSLSDGKITIEPKWHADGDGHVDWDQQVAAMVQRGELDLALGPTWAWDVLGVKSFEPLQSPFFIDSDALVAAIVSDSDLSGKLMAGMSDAGVTGLSLWPEGLRHPFGFEKPLVTPADFRGQIVRSPKSDLTTKIFAALGAKTSPEEPDATMMVGSQSEYALSPNGIGAVNLTFFPKVNVLYADTDSYTELDDAAKQILTAAALDTQAWAIGRTSDVAAGKDFCDGNHTLTVAGNDELTDLIAATKPVADTIKAAHPDVIAGISALKDGQPSPIYAATCTPAAPALRTHAPGPAEAALNGTYRFTLDSAALQKAGFNQEDAYANAGVWTWVLDNGALQFGIDTTEIPSDGEKINGLYQVDGTTLTLRFPEVLNIASTFNFNSHDNGDLELTIVSTTDPLGTAFVQSTMAGQVWERIT